MYLNAYVPELQTEGGVAAFFTHHRGHRFASSALMAPMTLSLVRRIMFSRLIVMTSSTISSAVRGRPCRVLGSERLDRPRRNLVAQRWIVRGEADRWCF